MSRFIRERATDSLLLAVARQQRPTAADALDAADVVAAARYHRLAPLTYLALRDSRPDIAMLLREDRDKAINHHLRVSLLLGLLRDLLGDVDWLVFKGPYLSEFAHPVAGLRMYGDVDILVPATRLRQTHERVLAEGWRVISSDETLSQSVLSGEFTIANRARLPVDVHWSMLADGALRSRLPVSTRAILDRREQVAIGGAPVAVPERADALVHLCVHSALDGATKLLHLLDADQLARQIDDWDAVFSRSRAWGVSPQVALVLGRIRRLLEAPVPEAASRELGMSGAFDAMLAGVDAAWPANRVRESTSMPRRVATSVRPGTIRTLGSVMVNGAIRIGQRLHPEPEPQFAHAEPQTIEAFIGAVERATDDPSWA
ncbi:MAG: nucleotidyltransferase family protein [Propionibacteriaceae bacterium]|nr:nucleotidyltransferase family protein [Propionibacteriaceae bacterium]